MPQINGEAHAWSQVTLTLGNNTITGVTKISYKETVKKENVYGSGTQPVGRSYGESEYECSITLLMAEVEALQRLSPTGKITDLIFDITVAFIPRNSTTNAIVRHKILYAEFLENARDMSKGDMSIEVELPVIPGGIEWGANAA